MTPIKTGVSHIEVSCHGTEILVQWQYLGSTLTHTEPFKKGQEEEALAFVRKLKEKSPHATTRNRLAEEGLATGGRAWQETSEMAPASQPDDALSTINTVETIVEAVAEAFSQPDPTPDPAPDNSFGSGGGDTGGGGATDSW